MEVESGEVELEVEKKAKVGNNGTAKSILKRQYEKRKNKKKNVKIKD